MFVMCDALLFRGHSVPLGAILIYDQEVRRTFKNFLEAELTVTLEVTVS